jgi:MFS family permease
MTLTKQTSVVIALGSAQTLAWGSTYYLPAILAAPMARELGQSTGLVFGAFSAALVVAAVLGPLAGRRIDLFGGRDVLAVSSVVFAAGLAKLGLAQSAGMLYEQTNGSSAVSAPRSWPKSAAAVWLGTDWSFNAPQRKECSQPVRSPPPVSPVGTFFFRS